MKFPLNSNVNLDLAESHRGIFTLDQAGNFDRPCRHPPPPPLPCRKRRYPPRCERARKRFIINRDGVFRGCRSTSPHRGIRGTRTLFTGKLKSTPEIVDIRGISLACGEDPRRNRRRFATAKRAFRRKEFERVQRRIIWSDLSSSSVLAIFGNFSMKR